MIIISFRMENPADHRTADAPDIVGGQARTDRLDRDREGDERGDRDEDEETGMDDACLDADTSGDECEHMSVSGDHHHNFTNITAVGTSTKDVTTTGRSGNLQDGSMGASIMFSTENLNLSLNREQDMLFSIFDTARPPPIPAEKTPCIRHSG
jgi:hypothetical protein